MSSDKSTVKPLLNKKIEGILFKINIDVVRDVLYLDIKSEKERKPILFSFDLNQKKECTYLQKTDGDRFTVLENVVNGVAIYSLYKNSNIPLKEGIFCFLMDDNSFWKNDFLTYQSVSENGIICSNNKFEPPTLYLLDYKTGELIKNVDDNNQDIISQDIVYPTYINSTYVLNVENKQILAYLKDNFQVLEILTENKQIYLDKDEVEFKELTSSPFFVYKNYLFYLKSGRVIVCILV